MDGKSSPRTPLLTLKPGEDHQSDRQNRSRNRKLQIVGATGPTSTSLCSSSDFELPNGWIVDGRPRGSNALEPGKVDKYYYEPGTGRQFRSLLAVQKYLSGETNVAYRQKLVVAGNSQNMQIVPRTFMKDSTFNLLDGWVTKEKPRNNINYAGHIDKFYIEPGTKKRLRSLSSLESYIRERKEHTKPSKPGDQYTGNKLIGETRSLKIVMKRPEDGGRNNIASKALKAGNHSMEVEASILDLSNPPAKIKWVRSGPDGHIWSPFINASRVPEPVKQKWSETFVLILNNRF